MGNKVTVEGGEPIDRALRRLRVKEAYELRRWSKKRLGFFEKPSAIRRKKKKMASLWQLRQRHLPRMALVRDCTNQMHLFNGKRAMFARSGLANTVDCDSDEAQRLSDPRRRHGLKGRKDRRYVRDD